MYNAYCLFRVFGFVSISNFSTSSPSCVCYSVFYLFRLIGFVSMRKLARVVTRGYFCLLSVTKDVEYSVLLIITFFQMSFSHSQRYRCPTFHGSGIIRCDMCA